MRSPNNKGCAGTCTGWWRWCFSEAAQPGSCTKYGCHSRLWQQQPKLQWFCCTFHSFYHPLRSSQSSKGKGWAAKKISKREGRNDNSVCLLSSLFLSAVGAKWAHVYNSKLIYLMQTVLFHWVFHLDTIIHSLSQKCGSIWLAEYCQSPQCKCEIGVFFLFPYPDPNPGDPRHQFPTSGRPYNCPGRWQNFWNGILPRASETKQGLCRIPPELCPGWRNWRGWTNKYSIVFSSNMSFSVKRVTDIFSVKCPLVLHGNLAFAFLYCHENYCLWPGLCYWEIFSQISFKISCGLS